jgi:hypothetical protein
MATGGDPKGGYGGGTGGASPGSGGAGGNGGRAATDPGPTPPPDWVPKFTHLEVLDDLRLDEPLSVLAPADCPTTFSLDWDLGRDGTRDAVEERIFDSKGRLVAAEMRSTDTDAESPRKRLSITYDERGRPTRYSYGLTGTRGLSGFIRACDDSSDGTVNPATGHRRGTVVDITYDPSGSTRVATIGTEECRGDVRNLVCETLEFDEKGRFTRRYRGCANSGDSGVSGAPPGAPLTFSIDDSMRYDEQGRPAEYRNIGFNERTVSLTYSYPSEHTAVLSWSDKEILATDNPIVQMLTRTLDDEGRITRESYDAGNNGVVDGLVTRAFDADHCGVDEKTDYEDDGLIDVTGRVECANHRVTRVRARNMLPKSVNDYSYEARLGTPEQGQGSVDVTYDDKGQVLTRSLSVTSLGTTLNTRSDSGTFTYTGGFGATGSIDRTLLAFHTDDGTIPLELSRATCSVKHACDGSVVSVDAELARCDLGLGAALAPPIYWQVPGLRLSTWYANGAPWMSFASFLSADVDLHFVLLQDTQ